MKIIIFGTGSVAEKTIAKIQSDVTVVAISDNNSEKWGALWHGYPIVSPDELSLLHFDYIVVCSMYTSEIIETLIQKGFSKSKVIPYFDNFYTSTDRVHDRNLLKTIIKTEEYEKSSIALVTRRNSGCNCRALFHLVPDSIKSNYKLNLIGLQQYVKQHAKYEYTFTTNTECRNYKSNLNIEIWHGFPLKTLGELEANGTDNYSNVNRGADYFLSYSDVYSYLMSSVFKVDINKFVVTGMPRNDFLNQLNPRDLLSKLLNENIQDKKIMYYVPTFRRRSDKEVREGHEIFTDKASFIKLDKYLQRLKGLVVVKKHPVEGDEYEQLQLSNIKFIDEADLQQHDIDFYQILGACDLLITDYSSIYFDFLLLNRPIVFWAKDIETYQTNRGFLFEDYMQWMPGPIVKTVEEVINSVDQFQQNKDWYETERLRVKTLIHKFEDFSSSQRVWDFFQTLSKVTE